MQRIESIQHFLKLKDGKKSWNNKDNIEFNYGLRYIIDSQYSGKQYKRVFSEHTNIELLKIQIMEGNIYVDNVDVE